MITAEKKEEYRKISSQLYIGINVIHNDKVKTITSIIKCRNQGTVGLSCDSCIGYIGLDNKSPCCYSCCYSLSISLIEEDFLSEKDFEI